MSRFLCFLGCFLLAAPLAAQPLTGGASASEEGLDRFRLPADEVAFVENRGQWPDEVAFLARLEGTDVWITSTEIVYDFYDRGSSSDGARRGRVLRARFAGGEAADVVGRNPQPTYHNYLTGDDPSQWATRVPVYREVVLRDVYDGASLELRAEDGVLKQAWVFAPSADPGAVRVEIEGMEGLTGMTTFDRAAVLGLSGQAPGARSGEPIRAAAAASSLGGMRRVYSRFLGGLFEERVGAVAVDAEGAMLLGGRTRSFDFPTPNGYDTTLGGFSDAYVARLDAGGEQLYGTFLGGSSADEARGIAYANQSAYVTGGTASSNFPTTSGAYDDEGSDQDDAFVTRLSLDGSAPVFSTYLSGGEGDGVGGGGGDSAGSAIAVVGNGNVVVGGRTFANEFPVPSGAYEGGGDAFVIVLSADGSDVEGGTFLGGNGLDEVRAVLLSGGNVYVAGDTDSNDFDDLSGGFGGGTDAFAARLNGSGGNVIGGTYIGGSGFEGATGSDEDERTGAIAMAVDGEGNIYVAGGTSSEDFPATFSIGPRGGTDAFVTRLNPQASSIAGTTIFGGSGTDQARGVNIAPDGTVHLAGETSSGDFPVQDADESSYGGNGDAFVVQLASGGSEVIYGTYLGGSERDGAYDLVVGADGLTYVAGETESGVSFPVTSGSPPYGGGGDAFAAAYDLMPNEAPVVANPLDDATLALDDPPLTADLNSVFDDPDGDALAFSCSSSDPGVASVGDCSGGTLTVTPEALGEATITVTADDGIDGVDDVFVVTVVSGNTPPTVVSPIGDVTLELGDSPFVTDLSTVFEDADGDALAFSCSSSAPSVASVGDCAGGTLTVTPEAIGEATITITASDPSDASASDDFIVTVISGNTAPTVANPIADAELSLGQPPLTIPLDAVFEDPDGDELDYECESSDPSVAVVGGCAGGTLSVTPASVGEAMVTVTATDPDGASAEDAFEVTVSNPPPVVADPIEDASLALGDDPLVVDLASVFGDPNGDALAYACSSEDSGVASVDECADGTLTVTPVGEGTTTVTVTASDGMNEVTDAFEVAVVNPPPVVASPIPDRALLLGGAPLVVDLDTVFADPNGDALGYTFAVDASAVLLALDGSVLLVTPNALGAATVTVTASDGSGAASEAFVVTVVDNLPPVVAEPVEDATLVLGEGPLVVALAGVFEDPEGDALAFSCTSSAPSVASVGGCAGGTLAVTPEAVGEATITVVADDGNSETETSFVVTVVSGNVPPVVVSPIDDATLDLGGSPLVVDLATVFDDSNGDQLVYACQSSDDSVASVSGCAGGTLTVTPVSEGTATIQVTATDPDDASATDVFTVIVGSNSPPVVVDPIQDVSLSLADGPTVLNIDAVFSDPEDGTLTFDCSSDDPDVATASECSDGTLTVTPVGNGSATVTVSAADPGGASVEDAFVVTVGCAPAMITRVTPSPAEPERGNGVVVTAAVQNGSEAVLYYRESGAPSFEATPMTASGGSFVATIPGSFVTTRGVEYFVEARSACGAPTQSARTALRVRVPAGVASPALPAATAQAGYRLVSVPLALEEEEAAAVLGDFGSADEEAWRLFELLPPGVTGDQRAVGTDDQWYEADPASIAMEPGRAFWLIVRDGGSFNTGAGTTVPSDEPFGIDLHSGWNLVGTPFGYGVPLDDIRMESGVPLQLQAYDGAWRNVTDSMEPFEGYAIRVTDADRLVVDPTSDATPPSARSRAPGGEATAELSSGDGGASWSVAIAAELGRARDDNNTAMVASGATDGRDALDWFEPPPIGDYVSVSFAPASGDSAPLTVDARPVSERGTSWPLQVRSNLEGQVALSFDGFGEVPQEFVVWLVDDAAGTVRDLRRNASYSLVSQGTGARSALRLVIGTEAYARAASGYDGTTPTEYRLAPSYPNPFRRAATIQYALPSAEHVTLEVFDITGRRVATLIDGEVEAGYHSVVWDGRATAGRAELASGVYIYRLRAGSFTATQRAVLVR